jgi:probable rRNA maturation factor
MILWTSRNLKAEQYRKKLTELALKILSDWGSPDLELSVLVTDDAEISSLNRDYRGKDGPTDVLSFSQMEGDDLGGGEVLGDVVISLDTAVRQAKEYGCPLSAEMERLLVHGVLHLLGYDHETGEGDAEAMRLMEKKYLPELWEG